MGQKNPYRVLDADYYKYAGPEAVKEVLQRGYDDILIDFDRSKMMRKRIIAGDATKVPGGFLYGVAAGEFPGIRDGTESETEKKLAESRGIWKRGDQKRILEKIFDQCRTDSVLARMPSRSRRSAGIFHVSCGANDIKGRFPNCYSGKASLIPEMSHNDLTG